MGLRNFQQKNVVITGASGNLGSALCKVFGQAGARIIALDLQPEGLQQLQSELATMQIPVFVQACDICERTALATALAAAREAFGTIDLLINNAGITHIQRLREVEQPEATLRKVMEVNFFGATNATTLLLPDLIAGKGMIINISSVAGFAPVVGRTAYAASKHAMHGYFESLRNELYADGVQCLMVCPSFIQADAARVAASAGDKNSIYQKKKIVGKASDPLDIAQQILRAAEANRPRLILGKAAKLPYFVRRFFPNLYEKLMRKKFEQGL